MNELVVFNELHKFLNSLGPMNCTIAPKSLCIGYKPITLWGKSSKFATIYGEKRYQSLIVHVDPFNPESTKGKEIQKEIQDNVGFNISEMRTFKLKNHEVYIPLELMVAQPTLNVVKEFMERQYNRFIASR